MIYSYMFRKVCPIWTKRATYFLKHVNILILMTPLKNAPSNSVNFASGEIGIGHRKPQLGSDEWEKKSIFTELAQQ